MRYIVLLLILINLNCSYTICRKRINENGYLKKTRTIKSIVECTVNSEGFTESKIVFSFDGKGNLIKRVKFENDLELEVDLYQYDNGKLIEKCIGLYEHFDPEDSEYRCAYIENYQYDKFGQKIKSIVYDTSSLINPITKLYYYNNELNQVKVNCLKENGTLIDSYIYYYDIYNRLLSMKQMNEKGIVQKKIEYSYDQRGIIRKKIILNEKDKLVEKYLYRYDGEDNLTFEKLIQYLKRGKNKFKSKYHYNLLGDRIKETKYSKGKIIEVKNREIMYYE